MTVTLLQGDCLAHMAALPTESVDSVVTDPPYHFASIVKRFGSAGAAPAQFGTDGAFARASRGFMGKEWDGGDIAFRPETWALALRALKPGGHLVAFGAPKNYHRLACAIEDAGFEIRDSLMWLFGTGFPKSPNIDGGWGTALKPAYEPIVLARKPLGGTVVGNMAAFGTGALNIDAARIPLSGETNPSIARRQGAINHLSDRPASETEAEGRIASRQSPDAFRAERSGEALGRWPANVVHDGSDEVVSAFPSAPGQLAKAAEGGDRRKDQHVYGAMVRGSDGAEPRGDSGSAARFFYSAKASKGDRAGSKHPTVKPVALMRWLVRLVTPPGGVVLDPFAGSGTTGQAAREEGFSAILIEREAEYQADIRRRLGLDEAWRHYNEGIFA